MFATHTHIIIIHHNSSYRIYPTNYDLFRKTYMHKCHHTMIAVFLRIAVRQILSKMDKRHQCRPFKPFEIHRIARLHRASLWISHHRALFGLVLHTKPWTGRHDTFKISEVWKHKGLWSVIYGHLSLDYNPRSWKEGGSSISSRLQPWFKEFSVLLFSPATMPATFLGTSLATSIEAEPKRVNTHTWVSLPRVYTVHAGIVCFHSTCIHLGIHG